MFLQKCKLALTRAKTSLRQNFRFATLDFLFIVAYIGLFGRLFGPENSSVGMIFTILMGASMLRDMTATPLRHLMLQSAVLVLMAAAACAVTALGPWLALPVNLVALVLILYAFTYEYMDHLYFPYILSYLFLIFLAPVPPSGLPKRMLAMLAGAVSIVLYQLVMGRRRVARTARQCLGDILQETDTCLECLLAGAGTPDAPQKVRENLFALSQTVYQRRHRVLGVTDAGFAMVDAGRDLEQLILQLYALQGPIGDDRRAVLRQIQARLRLFDRYLQRQVNTLPPLADPPVAAPQLRALWQTAAAVQADLVRMADPAHRRCRRTALGLRVQLKAALGASQVRVVYALRVGLLLALCTLAVQLLGLPHGKWLVFTVASVSLPYADDIPRKARQRLLATLAGGAVGALLFSLLPSAGARTAVMMLSGYLTFYFGSYVGTFGCSTVGALGGAVIAGVTDPWAVGGMLAVRLAYVLLGIAISLLCCRVLWPYDRERATRQLGEKYAYTAELLQRMCQSGSSDSQLYYTLVLKAYLMEEKLLQNAGAAGWADLDPKLEASRQKVRAARLPRQLEVCMQPQAV